MKDLLDMKKEKKAKNPDFIRQDAHKKPRVGTNWRKPRGRQSKMRLGLKGYRAIVKTGYKTPSALLNCNRQGLLIKSISSLDCLNAIDAKKECIIVASCIGTKKKIQILEKALEKKITVLNIKDPKSFIEEKTKQVKEHKKSSKEKLAMRAQKKKDLEKVTKKDKKESDKKEEKADKSEETKSAQKVMTKKEM